MSTDPAPPSDLTLLAGSILTEESVDPALSVRVQERAEKIWQRLEGMPDIAVQLIPESRDA